MNTSLNSCARNTRSFLPASIALALMFVPSFAFAQVERVNTGLTNVQVLLISVSAVVVTIAVIWVGMKMIFGGARLTDLANVLIGAILIGSASAIAAWLVG